MCCRIARRSNRHLAAFTLIELLVVISIIALLIAVLLPALKQARITARKAKNASQLRGIHLSMVVFAHDNNGYYPGLTSDGDITPSIPESTDDALHSLVNSSGASIESRFGLLIADKYIPPAYCLNPQDADKEAWSLTITDHGFSTHYFSYAMPKISNKDVAGAPQGNQGRRDEWRDTINSQAPVVCDRAISLLNAAPFHSIWTPANANQTNWQGDVAWNDSHVTFESTSIITARYTHGPTVVKDKLFANADAQNYGGDSTHDAHMIGKWWWREIVQN